MTPSTAVSESVLDLSDLPDPTDEEAGQVDGVLPAGEAGSTAPAEKSQVARWLSRLLRERGLRVVIVRHPMPYGNLELQAVQRFATMTDLAAASCTIEEREEYEPHLAMGTVVYAGADYARVIATASAEADIIVWDGGNNDFPFIEPDLQIVLVDPLRPGLEIGRAHV